MKLVLILAFYVLLGSSVGLLYENTVSPAPESNIQQEYTKKYDEFMTKGSLTEAEMEQLRQLSREYEAYEDEEGSQLFLERLGDFLLIIVLASLVLNMTTKLPLPKFLISLITFGSSAFPYLTMIELILVLMALTIGYVISATVKRFSELIKA